MAKRRWMTRWYSPSRLASIAVRVAVSTVFGAFADRREAIAAARSLDPVGISPMPQAVSEVGTRDKSCVPF